MTPRQRVLAALDHRQPDAVPYQISFTEPAHRAMAAWYRDPDFEARLGNCLIDLGTEPADSWREVRPAVWEDPFGVQWDRTIDRDIGTVCNQRVTKENLDAYRFPDPYDPRRFEHYPRLLATSGECFCFANLGFSLFERAWTLAGMENILVAMVEDKAYVHELLDRILDYNLAIIDGACAHPIDGMMFGDDWGHQRGVIMGATLWREFILPRVARMYSRVKAAGKRVLIHSCGKVDELLPDLIESGLEVFNPFQPEVMDVYETKRRFGARLSFYGGISTQRTLPYGTVREVRDEVRRLLDVVGEGGGYIAAPAHAVPKDAKPENIAAMIDVLQNQ